MDDVQVGGDQSPVTIPDLLAENTSYYIVAVPPTGSGGGGTDDAGGAGGGYGEEIRLTNVSNGSLTNPGPLQVERCSVDSENSNHHWTIIFKPENRNRGPIKISAVSSGFVISLHEGDTSDLSYFDVVQEGFEAEGHDEYHFTVDRTESTGDHQGKFHLTNVKANQAMGLAPDWETAGTGRHVKLHFMAGTSWVWHLRKV